MLGDSLIGGAIFRWLEIFCTVIYMAFEIASKVSEYHFGNKDRQIFVGNAKFHNKFLIYQTGCEVIFTQPVHGCLATASCLT